MADGLLLTRRERFRLFWLKFGYGVGPSLVLVITVLVLGGGVVGWVIAVFGVLCGLMIATNAQTTRGALVAGVVCAAILFVFQLVVAWFATHPILNE
jgi:hypothetical protein